MATLHTAGGYDRLIELEGGAEHQRVVYAVWQGQRCQPPSLGLEVRQATAEGTLGVGLREPPADDYRAKVEGWQEVREKPPLQPECVPPANLIRAREGAPGVRVEGEGEGER